MARVTYTTLDQVKSKLPHDFVTDALDDNKDGMIDTEVWQSVAEDAAQQVDARLGKRYAVPFDPKKIEAVVADASLIFILETLYLRRGYGIGYGEHANNPFISKADAARKELAAIGNGDTPLTPSAQQPQPSAMTFTDPARTSSRHGSISF